MVGQEKLRKTLVNLYKNNTLSRTNILIAPVGYGKKELVKWFSKGVGIDYLMFNGSIDSVREAIEKGRQNNGSMIYVFENIDSSKISQNALLKFLEEPPKNAIIFVLCVNKNLLLPTILNRGNLFEFERYSKEELKQFNDNELALEIFKSPKELIESKDIDIKALINTTDKIIEKIDLANVSNALKLNTYVKLKEEDKGYDLDMFVTALKYSFVKLYKEKRDNETLNKYNTLLNALTHIRYNNSKYFIDNFVLSNYLKVRNYGDT